jgi:iron complex transport system substrate-binding protein
MRLDRRAFTGGLVATLAAPRARAAGTVQDAAGRNVPVPDRVTRVFPAGPPAAILLYTLAPELLLGWPRANRAEECAYMLPEICARPEVGRLTGRGNSANLESVLGLKPDLILDVGSTAPTFVSLATRVQQQTGIPYALLDGRFDAAAATYRLLGKLTGRDAEPYATYAEEALFKVQTRVNRIPESERPRVYYARGPRGLETGLGGSINVETIEFLGAHNVAAERRGGMATVSVEQVLAWNPDVIITIEPMFAAALKTDPVWASVKAVQNGRVHLSPRLPFGWVDFPPSVNRLIGLWWLAKALYPEQFPEDLRPLTREFYTRFYHKTPTDAQIDSLLTGRA